LCHFDMSGDVASSQQWSALVADTVDKVYNKTENIYILVE